MNTKYNSILPSQIKKQKHYLQNAIFQMIPYREENYAYLDARFSSLLQELNGLNHLCGEQAEILTIMSLLEFARHENDFSQYRKAILDATAMVDCIKESDDVV